MIGSGRGKFHRYLLTEVILDQSVRMIDSGIFFCQKIARIPPLPMAEVIQFNCPACGMTLRLPLAMAAQQGPCPNCDREIIAPNPYHGIGAMMAAVPPPAPLPEPFALFAETPPLVPRHVEEEMMREAEPLPPHQAEQAVPLEEPASPVSEPEQPTPEPFSSPPPHPAPVPADRPSVHAVAEETCGRTILLLSCLVTGIVALIAGVLLGVAGTRFFDPKPAVQGPLIPPPAPPVARTEPEITTTPEAPVQVAPPIEPNPEVPKPAPPDPEPPKPASPPEPAPASPAKVSAGAEAALKAFLDAPDWATRSVYVLSPDKVKAVMEAYSREVPDGPTPYRSITVKQSEVDESTQSTIFIFMVTTERHPGGIPVAVKETPGGWLVDWLAFVEFRDDLFRKFADGPVDKTGFFHLIVTRPPEKRAAETENEHFSSFLLQSPMSEKGQLAFVRKGTPAYGTIQTATSGGSVFTPVLEVRKSKTSDGQGYFEVMDVKASDWFPREN